MKKKEKIQRYSIGNPYGKSAGMVENKDGEYILYAERCIDCLYLGMHNEISRLKKDIFSRDIVITMQSEEIVHLKDIMLNISALLKGKEEKCN